MPSYPPLAVWVANNISPRDVFVFNPPPAWPGAKNLAGLTHSPPVPLGTLQVGKLLWPRDASRFAFAHYFVTDNELLAIRQRVFPDSLSPGIPQDLKITWEEPGEPGQPDVFVDQVLTKMYFLAARPLQQIFGKNPKERDVYLMTLVDLRWFWWYAHTGEPTFTALSTWADVYTYLASKLKITITADPVSADYGRPDNHDWVNQPYQAVPLVLDAVAFNCGQRMVRKFNGVVQAMSYTTARNTFLDNLAAPTSSIKQAGGAFNWQLPVAV